MFNEMPAKVSWNDTCQSYDHPSVNEAVLKNMGEWSKQIHLAKMT